MAGVGHAINESGPAVAGQVVQLWSLSRFRPYDRNPRKNDHAVERVAAAIKEFGFKVPVLARSSGELVDGHLRLKAAAFLGLEAIPVLLADDLTDAQVRAFRISVNRMAELAEWDTDLLASELDELAALDVPVEMAGWTGAELEELTIETAATASVAAEEPAGNTAPPMDLPPVQTLAERFLCPPFSVLNAREGWWQDRKRAWIALGIQSELGRGGGTATPPHPPTVTRNPDGTLKYAGSITPASRFNAQIQAPPPPARTLGAIAGNLDTRTTRYQRKPRAVVRGAPLPAANYSKTRARGDGRGRPIK